MSVSTKQSASKKTVLPFVLIDYTIPSRIYNSLALALALALVLACRFKPLIVALSLSSFNCDRYEQSTL